MGWLETCLGGRRKYFWLVAFLVILGAALGGGIGGSKAAKTRNSDSSAVSKSSPSPTSSTPPINTGQTTAYSGGSVASVSWGADRDFELHIFYQDDTHYIRESIFKNGSWSQNGRAIVKTGSGTPIAAMFRPYNGGPNTSITICYMNPEGVIHGHVYNDDNDGVWKANGLGSTKQQTFVAAIPSHLTGTLLRQHQPNNGTSIWEPYVLFYQMPNQTIGEIVLWAASSAPASSALWMGGPQIPHLAVYNSPLTVTAAEYGFGLQLFFLAYAPKNLSTNPAVFNYPWWANSSTADISIPNNPSSQSLLIYDPLLQRSLQTPLLGQDSNVLGSYNKSMPECTYLESVTSPAGLLPLSVTHVLCVDSSGSVLRYQYPAGYRFPSVSTLPPISEVWGEVRDDPHVPISKPPPYVEVGGGSFSLWNSTVISLFWNETCGYNMICPSNMTSGFAHSLGIFFTCQRFGGGLGISDKWEFLMSVPTTGELQP